MEKGYGSKKDEMESIILDLIKAINDMDIADKVNAINRVKVALHQCSPMCNEPVDCVLWVPSERVMANDYNPNSVAPPEMTLLQHSIREDGYTQPIVAFDEGDQITVIDGFHRHRVGKECLDISERIHGYLPVVIINNDREDRSDRIASTIRHNRARGKHQVTAMSDIVLELTKRNWTDAKIAKELGMDSDEVLRLKQIGGLAEAFAHESFSEAWECV